MNMKKITFVLIGAMSLSNSVFADSVNPPGGPYRSMPGVEAFISSMPELNEAVTKESNSSASAPVNNSVNKSHQNNEPDWRKQRENNMQVWQNPPINQQSQQWGMPHYNQTEMPDWVKQRQHEMQQRMQQFHAQQQAQQQAQQENWEKRQAWNRNQPVQSESLNTQADTAQGDQVKQYFPSARGQVYGPQAVPPSYYARPRQHVYQARRPMPQYTPRWK